MDPLNIYFLLNMGIFHCYLSLTEGNLAFLGAYTPENQDDND